MTAAVTYDTPDGRAKVTDPDLYPDHRCRRCGEPLELHLDEVTGELYAPVVDYCSELCSR